MLMCFSRSSYWLLTLLSIGLTSRATAALTCSFQQANLDSVRSNTQLIKASGVALVGKAGGQTKAKTVKPTPNIKVSLLTDSLDHPWGLTFMPDGRMLVSEKAGRMKIVTPDGKISDPLAGIPPVLYSGDGGLLDVIVAPDFIKSRLIVWNYVENSGAEQVLAVAKGKLSLDEKTIENVQVIYRASPAYKGTQHFGSRLLVDKEGFLFISTGDRMDTTIRKQAQDLNSSLGKILRVTLDGKAAPGNPFINHKNAKPEIYALGVRDPQGLAFHPVNGELWESDHGPKGGDELNIIRPAANYGWPVISYGTEYDGSAVNGGLTQKKGLEQPVYYWDPAVAPSGMTFYSGALIPEWYGNLFVSTLRGSHIARLLLSKDNKVLGEERLLEDQSQRFRSVVQGPDGALYAITDEAMGSIYRIGR